MDRISKLPTSIIEAVLCLLPTQEAARTSILSKEWRYHWTKIPKLAFDEFEVTDDEAELSVLERTFSRPSNRKEMTKRCKIFYAVYQVLLFHQGPIHDFTLSVLADDSCVEIDHIILHLSKTNTIKVLKFDFCGQYKLPLCFFSLHKLTELYLTACVFDHQPSLSGFGSLTTLYLQEIQIRVKALLCLLSSCPLLKRLSILSDGGTIDDDGGGNNITNLIECLPGIEHFSLMCFIFTCFLPLPKRLPTTLVHLKYLRIEWVWLRHKYAGHFLVLLIRSSPFLEKLKLEMSIYDVFDESETGSFILEDYPDIMFEHLKDLEILNITNEDNDLVFVKLLLAKSPVLKNVRILVWDEFDEDEKLEISKTLLSFPCASPMVKVTVS